MNYCCYNYYQKRIRGERFLDIQPHGFDKYYYHKHDGIIESKE